MGSLVRQTALWQHYWAGYQPEADGAKTLTCAHADLAPDFQAKFDKMQEKIKTLQSQRDKAISQLDLAKPKGKGKGRDDHRDYRDYRDRDYEEDGEIKRRRR